MIVVDTNVIVHFWLNGEFTANTERLLSRDPEWAVPVLWRSEFRNVMALYLRKKIISLDKVLSIIENAEEQLRNNEFQVSSIDVIELVNNSKCSAYDCEFIALAKKLDTILVTTDKQILKEFPGITKTLSLL